MLRPYGKRTASSFVMASHLSDMLDRWPGLYLRLLSARLPQARHRIIGPGHRLVIEAFPRSGSSFAHQAFLEANPEAQGRVATHLHRSSQVIRASRMGKPVLILVRPPRETVVSLLALGIQQGQILPMGPREAERAMAAALLRYARFHERIAPLEGIVVAGFDEVTSDFGAVTERVNAAFGTDFVPFDHSGAAALMAGSRRHLAPNADRDAIKAGMAGTFDAPALAGPRARAEAVYHAMIARRDAQREAGR